LRNERKRGQRKAMAGGNNTTNPKSRELTAWESKALATNIARCVTQHQSMFPIGKTFEAQNYWKDLEAQIGFKNKQVQKDIFSFVPLLVREVQLSNKHRN
jgi:hypothetical protein